MKNPDWIKVDVRAGGKSFNWPWIIVYSILVFMIGALSYFAQIPFK